MRRALLILALCYATSVVLCGQSASASPADETGVTDLSSAAGVPWEFKPEGGAWKPLIVPGGGWRAQGYTCDAGTYRAPIDIPKNVSGRLARLAFDAVNFGAEVFIGPDEAHLAKIASHVNGWMPFTAALPPTAAPGSKVLLVVEVKGRRKFMVNGKYTVPEGATWCPTVEEGILRGVRLETLPPVHVEDIFVRTRLAPDTLTPQVTVANGSDKPVNVSLSATLASWYPPKGSGYPQIPAATAQLAPGETRTIDLGQVAWTAGPGSYWWPNVPYRLGYQAKLHLLDVALTVDGKPVHRVQQRFGFRQFKAVGAHYELNGVRCNLRGDNQQEADFGTDAYGIKPGFGPPSPHNPGWPQAVDNLLRLNFNVLRIHQIPATPYMLDVCDEKGLMLVDESPLRRSESGEDFVAGRDNMLNMDRELVRRDRNHPAVVIWSAVNEPFGVPAAFIRDLQNAIRAEDDSRPIIADGIGDLGPDIINMQHYVNGLGGLPLTGGTPRTDRPYGETEAVWDMDNTWQGFAWMATSIRIRRLKGNADLRNYVLNNAWSNYVPGESAETEILEKKVKNMGGNKEIRPALADPWNHLLIRLMQQCYHPLAVCDTEFDLKNARSNENGDWPVYKPRLASGAPVTRHLVAFNDEFDGEDVTVRWQLRGGGKTGPLLAQGESKLQIPVGEFRALDIAFDAPQEPGDVVLLLASFKDGQERFSEDKIVFAVKAGSAALVPDGDYRLVNAHSGLPAEVTGAATTDDAPVAQNKLDDAGAQMWRLKNLGNDEVTLTNVKTGLALAVRGNSKDDGALAVQQTPNGGEGQIWRLAEIGEGVYTLTNKASGKLLDVYASATTNNARVVQWAANGGDNQQWRIK